MVKFGQYLLDNIDPTIEPQVRIEEREREGRKAERRAGAK